MIKTSLLTFISVTFLLLFSEAQDPQAGWNFNYPGDSFTGAALLDLRYLNEGTAGENGFIGLSPDSSSFVTGNGKSIRFWPIGGGDFTKDLNNEAAIEAFARFLAKMGVNMIRFHGAVHPTSVYADITRANDTEVYSIWRMVAIMKKHGIYSVISPYWAGHVNNVPAGWGIDGYSGTTNQPWEVMYFDDKLKNAYKEWVKTLYTVTNPFTGIALKDDPAVALIQIAVFPLGHTVDLHGALRLRDQRRRECARDCRRHQLLVHARFSFEVHSCLGPITSRVCDRPERRSPCGEVSQV